MDIGSGKIGSSGGLSNFRPRVFIFDGIECASMEGLLQSFKFDKPHIQEHVCSLVGLRAKRKGQKRNKAWKSKQNLWWKEEVYKRDSKEYQDLLDAAFFSLAMQNKGFQRALLQSGDAVLRHSIGKSKTQDTVLTEAEFCSRLTWLRTQLNNGVIKIIE